MPGEGGPDPLLIVCALGIEHLALRSAVRDARGTRPGPAGPVALLRTGMGPRAARRAVDRMLGDQLRTGFAGVIATGFCAGLAPGMRPGDLVVAEEVRDAEGRMRCTGSDRLASALARLGTVHTGPLVSSDHVVRGAERTRLRATGALAVDMESAVTLRTATRSVAGTARGTCPIAAVRVVVDAPEHELVRLATVSGGISAFRVLRSVLPAFYEWHRSLLLPWR
ncbi:1-hydroxy-2-methyl-2-butenyl 4-diphosphate reductase [Streptomyces gobiensis]|uniref:phosphorylase family protein n=1 Tax=Streptomyces gobiensis TaxID=2875706 RepID=UPI001E48D72E|nr:1-hydroxy-2-methyl-2-butenyl 4-diphosphate reductase [Streptomyces gobiensis]UGY94531.1 1-hydroxy-2-methyl-2-butenyl 4-diphosphate reductase [Streptomyces gobiensis]